MCNYDAGQAYNLIYTDGAYIRLSSGPGQRWQSINKTSFLTLFQCLNICVEQIPECAIMMQDGHTI